MNQSFEDFEMHEWFGRGAGQYGHHTQYDFDMSPMIFRHTKLHDRRLLDVFSNLDHIETALPGIRYVYLVRSDIFARTVSIYFARMTKQWYLRTDDNGFFDKVIPFYSSILVDIYEEELELQNVWPEVLKGREFLEVQYEEVTKTPAKTIRRIGNYLNLVPAPFEDVQIDSLPMTRSETPEYIERLKELVGHDDEPSDEPDDEPRDTKIY
jgi:LPS sulfotransferase NodH